MSYRPIRRLVVVAALSAITFRLPAVVVAANDAPPADWALRSWQSDHGLPNNHVTGLAQTADGYLWVATYSAPARFDGMRFEEFLPKQLGIGSNQKISALALARDGGLWLGSLHGGVVRLAANHAQLFSDGLPYKPVQQLLEDGAGALWIVHQGGSVARWERGRLTTFGPANGLPAPDTPNRYVCTLALDARGQLWFSKDGQIGVFRDEHFVTLIRLSPRNAGIAPARGGGVWIAAEGRLLRCDENTALQEHARFANAPRETPALLEDSRGGVWIGTADSGLFHVRDGRVEAVATSDARISSLMEDRKGNIWVGTVGGGLNQVRPRVVALEAADTGLPTGVVQSLAEDTAGALWATTQSGLLLRRDGATWTTIGTAQGWPDGRASALAADPSGAVWIGTRDRALHRWQDGAFTSLRKIHGLAGREIHGLVLARNGDLWIGFSSPDIVQRLRQGKLETFTMPEGIRVIRAMTEDAAGSIWIGTSRGMLLRIRDGVVHDETPRTTGAPLSIRCLRATPDGGVWIGYADEGVGWWKGGRFRHLTATEGFPENNVSQIIADGDGHLWFAGDHGIFKVRQAALEALANGASPRAYFLRLGSSDGLASLEANFGDAPGATRTRDGRLWIPLRTALAVIEPARLRADPEPPVILLKRVAVDGRDVALYGSDVPRGAAIELRGASAPLWLAPDHERIAFEYAALDYVRPENSRFRYQLEGFDRGWIDAGATRAANYSRLPPGSYRFRVEACNGDGVWTEHGAAIAFAVTPFFWQTWWFRAAALLALVTLVGAIVRVLTLRRMRARLRTLEQQTALQRERMRIARDLHDEFGTRLTELGLIAEFAARRDAPGGAANAELLGNIRALERDLDTIVWTVNPQNDTLDHLVGFVCRVSGEFLARSGLRCRFEIPEDLPARPLSPELRHHLFLVAREAVNNIVKHAHATLVKIVVRLEGNELELRIENDGPGFVVGDATAHRNGLKNMRTRIAELGGTLDVASAPEAGTRVVVRVSLTGAPLAPIASDARPRENASWSETVPTQTA